MKKILLILLGFIVLSCTDEDYTTTPSATLMADKPIEINYNEDVLFVYPVNLNSTTIRWRGYSNEETGAISLSDGKTNTDSIVNKQGEGSYAAYLCDTLSAYNYSDWYLPSKNELKAIYDYFKNKESFFDDVYWSSTEYSKDSAYLQDFSDGKQYIASKTSYQYVICVRKED